MYQDSDGDINTPNVGEHIGYERLIYEFEHKNPDDYNVGEKFLKNYQKGIVGSGKGGRKIWVRVTFSETMDASWADFKLQLDPQGTGAGEAAIDATDIKWSKIDKIENNTVTGIITIPPKKHETIDSKGALGSADYSMDADIVINAQDTAGKKLDANSDGTSDSEDRNHKIKIDTKNDVRPDQNPHLKMEK